VNKSYRVHRRIRIQRPELVTSGKAGGLEFGQF